MDDYLCLVADDNSICPAHLVFPIGEYDFHRLKKIISYWNHVFKLAQRRFDIEFISANDVVLIKSILDSDFETELIEERDLFDYSYVVSDFLALQGSRNKFKRNFLHLIESKKYKLLENYTDSDFSECQHIYSNWKKWKHTYQMFDDADDIALQFFFDHHQNMEYVSYRLIIDNFPVAFFIGSYGNHNTFYFHFAKYDRNFKEANFLLHYLFIRDCLPKDIVRLNFEDDMGNPRLRFYKSHLSKFYLIEKYSFGSK